MILKIFLAFTLILSSGYAESNKENRIKDEKNKKNQEEQTGDELEGTPYKKSIGVVAGPTYGELAFGGLIQYFINPKNLINLSYYYWAKKNLQNLNQTVISKASVFELSDKYLFYGTFFVKGGLYYRNLIFTDINSNQPKDKDLGIVAGIGNQWTGKRWSFSVSWLNLALPITKIKDEYSYNHVKKFNPIEFSVSYFF